MDVNTLKEKAGFTLLEVMIALSILAVGILSLEGLFLSSITFTSVGGKETQAVMLASQKLEEFNHDSYVKVISGSDAGKINSQGSLTPAADDLCIFTRSWVVTADPNVTTGLKDITVTVAWPKSAASDVDRQISLVMKKAAD